MVLPVSAAAAGSSGGAGAMSYGAAGGSASGSGSSSLTQFFATIATAYSQYASARENRRIANFNAAMMDIQARDAIFRGELLSAQVRQKGTLIQGAQRAGFAGQNVDVQSGSALDVQEDTTYMAEIDALTVKNNAFREAFGFQTQASLTRLSGESEFRAGATKSVGTILGGVSKLAENYGSANKGS